MIPRATDLDSGSERPPAPLRGLEQPTEPAPKPGRRAKRKGDDSAFRPADGAVEIGSDEDDDSGRKRRWLRRD